MKQFLLVLCLVPLGAIASDSTTTKPLISQTIVYKTIQATEVYLVWGLDYWTVQPAKEFLPPNSFIKKNMAWSKMTGVRDSFAVTLQAPKGTVMHFMIWIPKDSAGRKTDGWDTYGDQTYNADFIENKRLVLTDVALWLPANEFDILRSGWVFLVTALALLAMSLIYYRKRLTFSKVNFLCGTLIYSVVLAFVIRYQMNNWFENNKLVVIGAVFSDIGWLLLITLFFGLPMYFARKSKILSNIIFGLFSFFILLNLLLSLLNIEIVEQIGRPLNYQWLYYSDFMNGVDAKNAISHNLSSRLIINMSMLLLGLLVLGFTGSFLKTRNSRKVVGVLSGVFILICAAGFYQTKIHQYRKAKVENPALALIGSAISSERDMQLFSMKVSEDTKRYVENIHKENFSNAFDSSGTIKNIIVLVLESVPVEYINLYDSTYNVTPSIRKWRSSSHVIKNMYAHIPATPNSMGSIVSGVYPLISYRSFVVDHEHTVFPSIPKVLKNQGWTSSIFFASDLKFSNMGEYLKLQGFNHLEDFYGMECDAYKKPTSLHPSQDIMDDRCLVERYFNWHDSTSNQKKFSIIWTNQTHYPYFNSNSDVLFTKDENLNRYLNALKTADEAFGLLMDGLEKRNELEQTLVMVTADHGEAFGTHNQTMHAGKVYEENVHIPYIFYNPRLFTGTSDDKVGGLIDIAPTIAHIVGERKPSAWQGKSLLAEADVERTFFISPYSDFLFGTRSGKWKYIFNATNNEGELYDLTNDSGELNNVIKLHKNISKKEHEIVAAWVQYHNECLKHSLVKRSSK